MKYKLFIACLLIYTLNANAQKISGITVVAPPDSVGISAFERVAQAKAEWVSFVPYGFHRMKETNIRYNLEWQWWGEKGQGIRSCIKMAKNLNMKVMLKPQIYVPGGWVGDVDYDTEAEWQAWEKGYREFIHFYLNIAAEMEVEVFCIGTEYKKAIIKREKFWRNLIKEARTKYQGYIIYSSNWDSYEEVPFWDQLDAVGISAYFPLTDEKTPSIKTLNQKWNPIKDNLRKFSRKTGKKIVFTEYGYLTIDRAAYRAWELEKQIKQSAINQDAQANAFTALYQSLVNEDWWAGGFIWKWFPEGKGHEGYPDKDYTPQDKKAEYVIREFYEYMNNHEANR